MARILELGAEGFLSYGNIKLQLEDSLIQLLGDNGVGKTNLITVLTEALFSKNPRGYAKGELLNRSGKFKSATIYVKFLGKDGSTYVATTIRNKTTAKVSLTKDGVDISAHTAKGTFELIEEVLGMNYELFLQYTYQSSRFPTEFLLATPKARRDYLSNLLDLNTINEDIEKVAQATKEAKAKLDILNKETLKATAALKALGDISQLIDVDMPALECAIADAKAEYDNLVNLTAEHVRASALLNSKIADRDKQVSALKRLVKPMPPTMPVMPIVKKPRTNELSDAKAEVADVMRRLGTVKSALADCKVALSKLKKPAEFCYACGHALDNAKALEMFLDEQNRLLELDKLRTNELANLQQALPELQGIVADITTRAGHWEKYDKEVITFDIKSNAYAADIAKYAAQEQELKENISRLTCEIENIVLPSYSKQLETEAYNHYTGLLAELNNAAFYKTKLDKVADIKSTLDSLSKETAIYTTRQKDLETLSKALKEILAKTIEGGIKTIERVTNKYLTEFNSKAFLRFSVEEDKVSVGCLFDGEEVSISTLSTGQFSRVSISTLLALRELLGKGNGLNFLMLDEVVGVLDNDGKEGLIDILTNMKGLSVFLVSHEWYHPMLSRLRVRYKPDGLSEIVKE